MNDALPPIKPDALASFRTRCRELRDSAISTLNGLNSRFAKLFPSFVGQIDSALEAIFGIASHPAFAVILAFILIAIGPLGIKTIPIAIYSACAVVWIWVTRAKSIKQLRAMPRFGVIVMLGLILVGVGGKCERLAWNAYNQQRAADSPPVVPKTKTEDKIPPEKPRSDRPIDVPVIKVSKPNTEKVSPKKQIDKQATPDASRVDAPQSNPRIPHPEDPYDGQSDSEVAGFILDEAKNMLADVKPCKENLEYERQQAADIGGLEIYKDYVRRKVRKIQSYSKDLRDLRKTALFRLGPAHRESDADEVLDRLLDLKPDSAGFVSSEFQCDDLGTVGLYFNRLGTKLKNKAASSR